MWSFQVSDIAIYYPIHPHVLDEVNETEKHK